MLKAQGIGQSTLQQSQLEKEMIRQGHYITIKELYEKGTAKKAIARLLGLDIKTVRRYLKKAEWTAYQREPKAQKLLLESDRSWLIGRMGEVGYNATVLFRELKHKGYQGSYETVKTFVMPYRDHSTKACLRYETHPGEQSQVDWGSAHVWLGESQVKVHFFALVLGYSRRLYVKGYLNERFANLINGHECAFEWFGGLTQDILYDNARTMITTHNVKTKELILNPGFKDFAEYYGFTPKFCKPYRPQTKGKIESGIKYIKKNFLVGRHFKDLSHLNEELEKWILEVADQRVHGTTHERPVDRFTQENLIPVRQTRPYQYVPAIERKVSLDGMVSFGGNRYSLPWRYVGKKVDLKIIQGHLIISSQDKVLAKHILLQGKHKQSVCPYHYKGLFHPSVKKHHTSPPLYDPYWKRDVEVDVRDLSFYERAASSSLCALEGESYAC